MRRNERWVEIHGFPLCQFHCGQLTGIWIESWQCGAQHSPQDVSETLYILFAVLPTLTHASQGLGLGDTIQKTWLQTRYMSGWLFQGHLSAALGGAALTQIEIFKPQVALEHPMLLK